MGLRNSTIVSCMDKGSKAFNALNFSSEALAAAQAEGSLQVNTVDLHWVLAFS